MSEYIPITDSSEIRDQVARIATSNCFRRRRKLLVLLEYLITETMAGRSADLTQKKIGVEVFGLPRSFDARSGVTVRINASRLRNSLDEYYRKEARPGEPRIFMPPRSYFIAVEVPKQGSPCYSNGAYGSRGFDNAAAAKKVSEADIIGQRGINLIERLCLEMGFLWHPTGLEAGIDGYIEVRLDTGVVTNWIIQVQSKATDRPFEAETESSFEFRCSARDLDYWLRGNAPVILVRSRPRSEEAYWKSLKDYFSDPLIRKSGKIVFNKTADRLDINARSALERLAIPENSGSYLGTRPRPEIVYSNLLEVSSFPKSYYVGASEFRTRGELFAALHEFEKSVPGEWVLNGKMLFSFHDLTSFPWTKACDRGSVEEHDTSEWSHTNDPARQRLFVQLLNACLREKMHHKGVKFSREDKCYFFRATKELSDREYAYLSREHMTSRLVFRGYANKRDNSRMSYYRHSAFQGRFVRYDDTWHLQVTPTYYFTRDGWRPSRYSADLLSGIKRLETNQAVHGQVVMWAHLLTERSLFDVDPSFLSFGSLLNFQIDVGLDDDAWLKHEDPEKSATLQSSIVNISGALFNESDFS